MRRLLACRPWMPTKVCTRQDERQLGVSATVTLALEVIGWSTADLLIRMQVSFDRADVEPCARALHT